MVSAPQQQMPKTSISPSDKLHRYHFHCLENVFPELYHSNITSLRPAMTHVSAAKINFPRTNETITQQYTPKAPQHQNNFEEAKSETQCLTESSNPVIANLLHET